MLPVHDPPLRLRGVLVLEMGEPFCSNQAFTLALLGIGVPICVILNETGTDEPAVPFMLQSQMSVLK